MEKSKAGRLVTCHYRRGGPGPVTCHRVMRGTRERISRIWTSLEPRGPGPGMVAPVWALTHCAHCAGERLARACNTRTRGRIRGQSGRRPGQSKAEKSWEGNALFLGNSSELREQREIPGRGEGAFQSAGKSLLTISIMFIF